MKYNPHGIIAQLSETQTSRPIIVVNLYDYEFPSLWLFVKAAKHSPNIILLYFSVLGVLFLSKKNFKARLMEDLSLTPYLLHTHLNSVF